MRLGLAALAAAAGWLVPATACAASPVFLNPGGPPDSRIVMIWNVFLVVAVVVLVGVGGAIVYAAIRFRRRSPDEMPPQVHGIVRLEVAWTVGPAILLLGLFGLNVVNVQYLRHGPNPASAAGRRGVDIGVVGRQFSWTFDYPNGKASIATLTIPVGVPIYLHTRSLDVIHGFWVPQLGAKIDALPGIVNHAFIEASRPGTYRGQCYEFCGVGHDQMLITVKAVSMAQYRATIARLPSAASTGT
ncbi:MAG TPA: cytochrome c oxidase subunit II [Candidatus Dormibacteraeota bacterium]|nr:cytochrome c oxidase subunit II [Candidatus Dormibacteraeota bacterium]